MAALLTIALIPVGLVAMMQTSSVAEKASTNAELALLALTEQSASRERQALKTARGAAEALAVSVGTLNADPAACSRTMTDYVARSDGFSFAAFVETDMIVRCSSAGRILDVSNDAQVQALMQAQEPAITMVPFGEVSLTSVIVVYSPVYDEAGVFDGFIAISVPHDSLTAPGQAELRGELVELITFNRRGEILTSMHDIADADMYLPRDLNLSVLLEGERRAYTLEDSTGAWRIYTVASIETGQAYALGVWDSTASLARQSRGDIISFLFPTLMWLAGLIVALVAVDRLVIRHLQVLGRQMALFTAARRMPADGEAMNPPTEIRRIQRAFYRMTEALLQDEARLENAVREKSVLVKEIHHRVKNNLQLISSIINMQVRNATSDEAKTALRETQDRVLSMATIHRDLYQTNETGLVDVGHLLREVVGSTLEITPGIDDVAVTMDVGEVWLFPDQAVPMSLLASEAVINALKHMPPAEAVAGPRWLTISMTRDAARNCLFVCKNVAVAVAPKSGGNSGMGRKLIKAFATQLGAKVQMTSDEKQYGLQVTFTALEFAPAPGNF